LVLPARVPLKRSSHVLPGLVAAFVFSALIASAIAGSEGGAARLAGRVLDVDGGPVEGATVTLRAAETGELRRVRTTADGRYEFAAIAEGRYVIDATFNGTSRAAARDVRLDPSRSEQGDLDLRLDHAAREEQVVVTAADRPQRIDEVGKAITVISQGDFDLRQQPHIPELLRTVPGVQVISNGGPGQLTQIRLRGLRADATAILVDGLRFRDAASTQGDAVDLLSGLYVVNADRIETLRGSASSLYGTNATGGVVNIVSHQGGPSPLGASSGLTQASVQIEAGQLGLSRGRVNFDGASSRVRYSAGMSRLDVRDGVDGDDSARNTDGQGTVAVQFSPVTALTGRIWAGRSSADLNGSPSTSGIPAANIPTSGVVTARALAPDQVRRLLAGQSVDYGDATYIPNLDNPDYSRHADLFTGALVLTHHLSSRASLRATYQRVRTARTFEDGPRGGGFQPLSDNYSRYVGNIDTADVRASVELRPDLLVTGGYEFEREGYFDHQDNHEPAASRVDVDTRIRQRAHAFFGQASWSGLNDRLHVAGAVRTQAFSLSRPVFRFSGTAQNYDNVAFDATPSAVTGDAAVSYSIPSSGTRVRVHVGNAYRAPALYERFGGGFSSNPFSGQVEFSPFGDPLLEPDRYVSIDAGVDQSFARDRARVHVTYFHTDIEQVTAFDFSGGINPATDPYGRFVGYLNGDGGRSRGIEIGGQIRPSSTLSLSTSYTFADSVTDRDVVVPGVFRSMGIARHAFSLTAVQQIGTRLSVHGVLIATSERYGTQYDAAFQPRAYAYPGFATLNLGAAYTLPLAQGTRSLRVFGRLENAFDREYYDLGWRAPGAVFTAGAAFSFGAGRS
jgi:vitamin B12 transporter